MQKQVEDQNIWQVVTATDPAQAEPVAVEAVSYDGAQLVGDIKALLTSRGSLSLRGVTRMFLIMDDNKNKQLDATELTNGL